MSKDEQDDIRTGLIICCLIIMLLCGLFIGIQLERKMDATRHQVTVTK